MVILTLIKYYQTIHKSRSSYLGATLELIDEYNSNLICLSGGRNGICGLNALHNSSSVTS